jgi:iron(III) transport system substrate-binding protein
MIRIMRRAAVILALLIAVGCSKTDQPQVVLYVSADDYVARPVVAAFEKETGIRVLMVGDTEAKKTAGLVQRLRTERDRPVADVFWSSEIFLTIALADEGVLEPFESEALRDWPVRDPRNRWFGFAARARVIVYSPDRLAEQDRPRTWLDLANLANDKFRGRIVMADPRFGTTGGHLGAMLAYWSATPDADFQGWGQSYWGRFSDGLAANRVRLLPGGNAQVVEAVARGEADLGLTDSDDVWAAQRRGQGVDLIYARHHWEESAAGGGTLLIPNTVARVRGGPNPRNAAALIEFLLSPGVERMLAESDSRNVPLNPQLAGEFPELTVPDPLLVDWGQAAALRQRAIDEVMQALAP